MVPLMLALLACAPGEEEDLGPFITGTITLDERGDAAEIEFFKAVAFDQGGGFIAYLSSNPAATCTNIVEYLTTGAPVDPVDVLSGGTCNLFIKTGSGYDGGMDVTDDGIVGAGTSLSCHFGEGGWVYEQRDVGDVDYFWQGLEWQGHVESFSFDISGGAEAPYAMEIAMSSYNGSLIYEGLESAAASGEVSGSIEAEWCPGLATTGLF